MNKIQKLSTLLLYRHFPIFALKLSGAKIGQNVFWGQDIYVEKENIHLLTVEDEVVIAAKTNIIFHDSSLNNIDSSSVKYGKITFKKNCYIGFGATILPGTKVGENTIIGAKSLLKGFYKSNSVYFGSPAKYFCKISEFKKNWRKNNKFIILKNQPKWFKENKFKLRF